MGQHRRRHATNTNCHYSWTGANLQKQTGTESTYTEPDADQIQYQEQF